MRRAFHGGDPAALARRLGLPAVPVLDFSASLNPLGPPPGWRAALRTAGRDALSYPDVEGRPLADAAARAFRLRPDRVVAANGSTEILHLAVRVLAPRRVLVPAPAYAGYAEAAEGGGAAVVHKGCLRGAGPAPPPPLPDPAGFDLAFLGNPDNPCGRLRPRSEIEAWIASSPRTVFVIDEAFLPLAGRGRDASLFGRGHRNAIVVGSLTKAFAVPGLRAGYAEGPAPLAARLRAAKEPWSVGGIAVRMGVWLLARRGHVRRSAGRIARWRERLCRSLARIPGVLPWPSAANYVLCALPPGLGGPSPVVRGLLQRRIAVRDASRFPGIPFPAIRVAVRRPGENRRLARALREVLE